MFKNSVTSIRRVIPSLLPRQYSTRTATNVNPIPKRPTKKIKIGKARPLIYYKFNCLVELSDGSVVERRSQYPKTEIRMIQDQRNNALWNESRSDMTVVEDVRGKLYSFRQKYSDFDANEESKLDLVEELDKEDDTDEFLELMTKNVVEKKLGGHIYNKRK